MSADTAERTIAVIAKFKNMPADQITLDTSLQDLELDSLDGLNLVFELEEEFDILIPDDKALTMKTVGEMVEGIDRLLSGEVPEDNSAEPVEADSVKAEGS
ncbi:MAG: phosphopantetheine-binding protein [Pyrinomonadaceae bacterium]